MGTHVAVVDLGGERGTYFVRHFLPLGRIHFAHDGVHVDLTHVIISGFKLVKQI